MGSENKSTEKPPEPTTVVSEQPAKAFGSRQLIVVGLVFLAVFLLAGASWALVKHNTHKTTKTTTVAVVKPKYVTATATTYASVAATTNDQINAASTPAAKAALYDKLATNAQTAGKPSDAQQAAAAAEQLAPTADRAAKLGYLAEANNDWAAAVTWFQKAVDMTPKTSDPQVNDAYNGYVNALKQAKSHQ